MNLTSPIIPESALVIIDMQNDFCLRGAVAEIPGTAANVSRLAVLARAFRHAQRPIIHIVRLYEDDGRNVDLCRREKVASGTRIVSPNSHGSEIVEELLPSAAIKLQPAILLAGTAQLIGPKEWIIYKPRWGAFYHTPLDPLLKQEEVRDLVFAGCNFPNCPRTSIFEASERDYRIALCRDAISGLYDQGIAELQNIGVECLTSAEVLTSLKKS